MQHTVVGGVHLFKDEDNGINIRIDRIQQTKAYTMGNVQVTADREELTGIMYYGTFRLNEDKDKRNTILRCTERSHGTIGQTTWDSIIEQACTETDMHIKKGRDPIVLAHMEPPQGEEFLLYPLVLGGNRSTMVYADGGSLKTYLAGHIAILAAMKGINVLALDWETDEDEWWKRMQRLARGRNVPLPENIIYRPQIGKLADDGERIHETAALYNAGLIIIDSLTGAVKGELIDSQPIEDIRTVFNDIRIPSLLIHHKNAEGKQYGSVMFHNYVRLQWEAHAERAGTQSKYALTLTPKKSNVGPLVRSVNFDVEFNVKDPKQYTDGDSVTFKQQRAPKVGTDGFKAMSPQQQITQYLLAHGSASAQDLSTSLDLTMDRVHNSLADMVLNQKLIELPDGRYGVVQHG